MDFTTMTKKELLVVAAQAEIKGRHDMSKEQLVAALNQSVLDSKCSADEVDDLEEVEEAAAPAEELNELPVRPAIVEEEPKQKKAYVNKSGNVPYKQKPYFLDMETYNQSAEALAKAPNQVKLILKCMAEAGIVDYDAAMIGREIVDLAKKNGYLTTTIPSANLFAYYRRELEKYGVTYTG